MVASPAPLPAVLPDDCRLKLEDIEQAGDMIVLGCVVNRRIGEVPRLRHLLGASP